MRGYRTGYPQSIDNPHLEITIPNNDTINKEKNIHYHKILKDIQEKNLDNDFRRLIHLIKAEEYVPDSAIVEYAVLHDLIEKSGSFYSFTDDGAIVAKLFINASLPKIVEPEKE